MFAEVVAIEEVTMDVAPVRLIVPLILGLACLAVVVAAAVVLIVWAARRSSRPTLPPGDFDEPGGSAGLPDTRITR
jgi:hypothetical protein